MTGTPVAGRFYTLTGQETAYTSDIWEVIEVNQTHAVVKTVRNNLSEPLIIPIARYNWAEAENLAKAYRENKRQESASPG